MQAPEILQPIVALLFILALILGGAWVARRTGLLKTRGKPASIRVVGSQSLGGRSFISIVEVEDARLVIGITPQNITLLHTLEKNKAMLDSAPSDT
ncbi:MAG TPA: flagellar biosynthetic protein FliO [Pusillimonas sp.]|jgi:flagellar protein FliO/FliZ|nr:flagellar biosynthetic protein FliO [Pusillimonas sp.]MBC43082.1 flagellar biosynthetic protein FliO [Pusillimonas sp.]HBT31474.1 flagellar biosynthetic protein FliO [Pusillimonas sp.]HCN72562.1 flagellar biosynthetic protein FliO [Pusillimonas sp.]HCP77805.1 flagellar biosynthetic protein FliO [Pusillimonas sp.]|tara:strand:- start:222459 stop:222746 length:288 start_codon:yes stop_codon:yes gene_type:complete